MPYCCTTTAEVYGIASLKAQMSGMIIVGTRIGGLAETIEPGNKLINDVAAPERLFTFKENVIKVLKNIDSEETAIQRCRNIEFASKRNWQAVGDKWLNEMKKF
jgi:glycosyltransferase involved in cell wall biosynthesis